MDAGWLYAKDLDPSSTWIKHKRAYHRYQRRAHIRLMKKKGDFTRTQRLARADKEFWEYGSTIDYKNMFTSTKTSTDFAKRRRWTRPVDYVGGRYCV